MAIIVQQVKESWQEIWEQLSEKGCVTVEPGRLCDHGSIDDDDFNSYASFRLTGKPYKGANRTLILETAWSGFTYHFFSRLGKHYVLYNGGRNGYLSQNLLPNFTVIGEEKMLDLDEVR